MRLSEYLKKRSVELAFTFAVALCIIIAGTFAWFSLIQSTTNEFVYEPADQADLHLVKYEAGTQLPLAGAVFDLFDENNVRVGRYTTGDTGEILVSGLDETKKYYFTEVKPPYGYSIPEKNTTELVGTGGETLVVYNTPIKTTLSIAKRIGDTDLNGDPYIPTPEDLAFPFAFTVRIGENDGTAYPYKIIGENGGRIPGYDYSYEDGTKITVSGQGIIRSGENIYLRHGETAVIEDIPALTYYQVIEQNYFEAIYDEDVLKNDDFGCNDSEHKHVKEIGVASGWAGYGDNTVGNLREEGSVAVFENRRVPEKYEITIASLVVVDRILAHPDDIDPEKGFSVTVAVGDDPDQRYWYEVIHPEPIKAVLPDYDHEYEYYHRNDPGTPEPLEPQTVSAAADAKFLLPELPGSYAAALPVHMPSDYERWHQTDGTVQALSLSDGNVITVDLHHGSAVIIYGIPTGTHYTAEQVDYRYIDGYMIDSTIKTEGVILPDLEVLPDTDTDDPLLLRVRADIYNYFVRPIMKTITITKKWDHTGNSGQPPESTVIDVIDVDTGLQFDSRTLIRMDDWLASVTVPKYDPVTGELIDYGLTEHLPPDYVLGKLTPTEDGFTLTNTYAPATVKPGVQKVIEVTGDAPTRNGTFIFEIKALTAGAPMPEGGNTVSILGEGTAFFGNIRFDRAGTYSYRVWEHSDGLTGYSYDTSAYIMTVKVTDDGTGNLTAVAAYSKNGQAASSPLVFRNRYTKQQTLETGSLTITKRVTGTSADKTRKFNFTVTLGNMIYRIALADGEHYTFTKIPVGTRYSVTEAQADGYVASSSGSSGVIRKNGSTADFINTSDQPPDVERGSLVVKKTVTGTFLDTTKRFRFVVRIGEVEYELYLRHGEAKTFEGIPVGTSYTVVEDDYSAQHYTSTGKNTTGIITTAGAVASFENRYNSPTPPTPETGRVQVSGQKIWNHGSNPEAGWPEAITVYVLNGSSIVAQKTVSAADDWRYTFELPGYDGAGTPITYSVSEAPVEHYDVSIEGYHITNTYTGSTGGSGEPGVPGPGKPSGGTGDTPKTGDSSDLRFWFLVLLASTVVLWRVVFYWEPKAKR